MPDEELSRIIDPIMATVDRNNDGFIDYGEYRLNSEKTEQT